MNFRPKLLSTSQVDKVRSLYRRYQARTTCRILLNIIFSIKLFLEHMIFEHPKIEQKYFLGCQFTVSDVFFPTLI